jgi:hypothetical protein
MTRMRKAALAALGIVLVFMSGCTRTVVTPPSTGQGHGEGPGPNQHFGQMSLREFQVYIYSPDPTKPDQCLLDWPVAILWKSANQTVTWFSDDNNQYTIDFTQGSPFSSPTFTVPMGGSVSSGKIQSGTGYYPFAVHAGDKSGPICKKATDPDPGYYVK